MFKINDQYRLPKLGGTECNYPNILSLFTAIQQCESGILPLKDIGFHFRFKYSGKVTAAYITTLSLYLNDSVIDKLAERLDNIYPYEVAMRFTQQEVNGLCNGEFLYSNVENQVLSQKHHKIFKQILSDKITTNEQFFELQAPSVALFWFVNSEGETKLQLVANNSHALTMLRPEFFEEDLLMLSRAIYSVST